MAIGSVIVNFIAETSQFRSDLGKAAQVSDKFTRDMARNVKVATTGFLALAGSVSTTAATLTQMAINNADHINDLSKSAGISTESFSGLAYAAKQSGVEVEGLAAGIKHLNVNMAAAAGGNKQMQDTFAALGINIKNSDGSLKDASQTLSEIADKFSTYKDGAEKSALAVQLFGKSGEDLIPLLDEGGKGIQSMTDRAAELGIVISQETANAADAFNDKLGDMSAIAQGIGTNLAAQLLPQLNNLTSMFLEAAKNGDALSGTTETLANFFKGAASAAIGFGTSVAIAGKWLGGFAASVNALLHGNLTEYNQIKDEISADIQKMSGEGATLISKLWDEPAKQIETKAPETAKQLAAPIIQTVSEVKKAHDKIVKEVKMTYDDFKDNSQDAFEASQYLSSQSKESYAEITEMSIEAAKATQQAFADFLFDPFNGGLKGMVQNFGVALQHMIANAAAAQLGKYLFGDFANGGQIGGVIGGFFSSGISSGASISGLSGASFAGAFANGGNIPSGSWGIAGERGVPEIVKGPATVISGKDTAKMMGGHTFQFNFGSNVNEKDARKAGGAAAREFLGIIGRSQRYV